MNAAISQAEAFLEGRRSTADADPGVLNAMAQSPDGATFGHLLAVFPSLAGAKVVTSNKYRLAARTGVALFGASTPIKKVGPSRLAKAIARREQGVPELGLSPVKPTTAESALRDLVTLVGHLNDLEDDDDLKPVPPCYFSQGKIKWPNHEKGRRSAAKTEAFELLMLPYEQRNDDGSVVTLPPPVDAVDPSGRLRLFLAFAYYVGRRFSAILNLFWEDLQTDI